MLSPGTTVRYCIIQSRQPACKPASPNHGWKGEQPIRVGEVTQCCTVQECTALSLWGLHLLRTYLMIPSILCLALTWSTPRCFDRMLSRRRRIRRMMMVLMTMMRAGAQGEVLLAHVSPSFPHFPHFPRSLVSLPFLSFFFFLLPFPLYSILPSLPLPSCPHEHTMLTSAFCLR